jgi:FlaA1/EpsC-like NDP-sugar epimerase
MEEYGTVEVKEIGGRPGEKLDEMLISKHESTLAYCYDKNYFIILPTKYDSKLHEKYKNLPKFDHEEFSSKTFKMNKEEIKNMLSKGKFI